MKYKGKEYVEITPDGARAQTSPELRAGIDVGSTTVKLAILDRQDDVVWSIYERHHSDVRATIAQVLEKAAEEYGDKQMTVAITGSGGLLLAKWLGVEFVQEVIASKTAVETCSNARGVCLPYAGAAGRAFYSW